MKLRVLTEAIEGFDVVLLCSIYRGMKAFPVVVVRPVFRDVLWLTLGLRSYIFVGLRFICCGNNDFCYLFD